MGHTAGRTGNARQHSVSVACCMQGKTLESKLLSTNSAIALLFRHYFAQGVREAHKVLGGTGPAIAQIPLTVLWAGGTMFDLTLDLASRRAGALSALPRMSFITFTASAQLLGVASKMAAAFLAILPYERRGDLSDAATVARYVVRPQNAIEAFGMATKALFQVRARLPSAVCWGAGWRTGAGVQMIAA